MLTVNLGIIIIESFKKGRFVHQIRVFTNNIIYNYICFTFGFASGWLVPSPFLRSNRYYALVHNNVARV